MQIFSINTSNEGEIRKNILNADLVDCIVALPNKLFYTTGIPVCICFFNREKKHKGQTLFIDTRKMGDMVNRRLRELSDEDIFKIADTYIKSQEEDENNVLIESRNNIFPKLMSGETRVDEIDL